MKTCIRFLILAAALLPTCACTVLSADLPGVGTAWALRPLWSNVALTITTPSGLTLTYGSKLDPNAPLQAAWLGAATDLVKAGAELKGVK